jgi:3-O-alpha-D-mannopyranosyl-alpha-D-mannopyranose xylosylphosphotransferase
VRSVLEALPGSIETCHLIVADYPYNHTTDQRLETEALASVLPGNRSLVRVAQIPHWLDFAKIGCRPTQGSRDPIIQLVTHSDIFHLPSDGSPGETDLEEEWRQKALPSFNSKAIESRIGWVPGLVSNIPGVVFPSR